MEENLRSRRRGQSLRKNMTKEERHLWYDFLKNYPVQFKRQYQIGCYYADFYCFQAGLVVELDGSQHYDPASMTYDAARTAYLQQQGLTVLRFTNTEIMEQFRAVCDLIDHTVQARMKD